jgi:Sigma-70, region 4
VPAPRVSAPAPGGSPSAPAGPAGALAGAAPSAGAPTQGAGAATGAAGGPVLAAAQARSARLVRPGGGGRRSRGARRGSGKPLYGTRYRTRKSLVRAFEGCLDRLPRVQSQVLILRFGVGRVDPRSPRTVARMVGVSTSRYGTIERRALRRLTMSARRSACEAGGADQLTLAAAYAPVVRAALARVADAAPGASAASEPEGGVLGERESGGSQEPSAKPERPALAPPLADVGPGANNPFFLALLALGAAALVFIVRDLMRSMR